MLQTTKELEELSHQIHTTAPPERLQADAQTISDLVASGLSASALREGDVAPDFALPDTHGHVLALKTLLDRGPVVISFYRGGWCPFCNLELRGLQRVFPEIVQVGASLVAISPQLPDNSLSTEEKNQRKRPAKTVLTQWKVSGTGELDGVVSEGEAAEEKDVGRGIGHGYCARSIGHWNRRLGSPDTVVAGSRDSGRVRRCESASRACAWQEGMRL